MIQTMSTCPGEVIDFPTLFEENTAIAGTPSRMGRVERVDYTTDVYEDGITYPKYCYVYLPYCYDEKDTERKYNVLYYQHGNTCEPEIFAEEPNKYMLDMLFDTDELEPCIIVSTTYYFDLVKDREIRKTTGYVQAGDGGYLEMKANFHKEVVQNIIPAVEMRYNTYLTDPSDEGIKATRDHRAFSGYSRGSVATWKIFHYDFEYFRWFAPMSCHCTADHYIRDEFSMEEVMEYLKAPVNAHPELPFFIYASSGFPNDAVKMHEQMRYLTREPEFKYGENIYFSLSGFHHTDLLVPYYYYNSLKVLFKQ